MSEEYIDNDDMNEENDFAAMFEASQQGVSQQLRPGDKVEGTLLQLGKDWSFLDIGEKGEGVLSTAELLDKDGEAKYKAGDILTVYFMSRAGGESRVTMRIGGGGNSGMDQLENAHAGGIPVEGKIEKEIKGGYEVKLAGNARAFCPFSQSGLRVAEASELIGRELPFKITQFSERGRNIVVSHRALLDEDRQQLRETLRQTLEEGMVVKGTVTNILGFGAFVDIGGIEGLLPISEISYGRVEDVNDILNVGQELEVAVKKIDWENNKFSFSLRETQANPWNKVGTIYKEGQAYPGKVCRLAQFGAFVTLEDGIDGLLHISKLNGEGQRVRHPQDLLKVGEKIEVVIEKIDQQEKRLSLALAGQQDEIEETSYADSPVSSGLGTLGDLLKAAKKN